MHKKEIRLHIESLHRVLPDLNPEEQRQLTNKVREGGWLADENAPSTLHEAQQRPLRAYHSLVIEALKLKGGC